MTAYRRRGIPKSAQVKPVILLIAGFGDNASMYEGLQGSCLTKDYDLLPLNLPGFGAPRLPDDTSLDSLASFVAEKAKETGAKIIVAHSVASIIASLAAQKPGCPLSTILSLEGNLTADDAYFSGTAADYDDPDRFRIAFLKRLDAMAEANPLVARYRRNVEAADPLALWQLGRDARRFSEKTTPGEVLMTAGRVTYLYNPDNCPDSSLRWLASNPIRRLVLDRATHWKSVDQPQLLSDKMLEALK